MRRDHPIEIGHRPRHFNGSACRLGTAIMGLAQTPDSSLVLVLEQQHLMDDRDPVRDLNLCQGIADAFTDVLRMRCFSSQDNSQANHCLKWRLAISS